MVSTRAIRVGLSAVALGAAVVASSASYAQGPPGQPTTLKPPTPGREDTSRPLVMTIVAGLVIVASVIGANMIPAKRGHQD
jgi:hypothetical protein